MNAVPVVVHPEHLVDMRIVAGATSVGDTCGPCPNQFIWEYWFPFMSFT